jgi:hypothetical protein
MTDIGVVLNSIRNSFSYLWSEYGFKLTELKPTEGYRFNGYEICLENEFSKIVFMSESGLLDEIYIRTKQLPYFGRGLKYLTKLLTQKDYDKFHRSRTTDEAFGYVATYIQPIVSDIINLAQTPTLFKETIETLESLKKSEQITLDMIRAERERLSFLGADSSLGAALENLQQRGRHE